MDLKTLRSDPRKRLLVWIVATGLGAMVGAWLARGRAADTRTSAERWADLARMGFTPAMIVAVLLWSVVSVYWEIAARAGTTTKERAGSRSVHIVLTSVAQLFVILPVPGLRARFLPAAWWVVAAGLAIEVVGVAVAIWSRRVLGRNWSGAIATNVDHELVRSGPYAKIRHPIYTGLLLIYVGVAIVSGEVHALAGVAIALVAYARKIAMEERHLESVFGAAYADYRRGTWRLIPGLY